MSKPFDLKFIPFSTLHISQLNMRHSETAPDIEDILPSVKAVSYTHLTLPTILLV